MPLLKLAPHATRALLTGIMSSKKTLRPNITFERKYQRRAVKMPEEEWEIIRDH